MTKSLAQIQRTSQAQSSIWFQNVLEWLIMEWGKKLKNLRDRLNYSQITLAKEANISRNMVSLFENDHHTPNIETLEKIVGACKTTLAEFFGSRIPTKYADPRHHELHEQLQELLQSRDFAQGAEQVIDGLWNKMLAAARDGPAEEAKRQSGR